MHSKTGMEERTILVNDTEQMAEFETDLPVCFDVDRMTELVDLDSEQKIEQTCTSNGRHHGHIDHKAYK